MKEIECEMWVDTDTFVDLPCPITSDIAMSPLPLEPSMTSGTYNANASMQNAAMQPSINLLVDAVASLPSREEEEGRGPIRVVDFGASQGANSMQPCKAILDAIRSKALHQGKGGITEVEVYHEDLPSNDWSSVLALVNDPLTTYVPKVAKH